MEKLFSEYILSQLMLRRDPKKTNVLRIWHHLSTVKMDSQTINLTSGSWHNNRTATRAGAGKVLISFCWFS